LLVAGSILTAAACAELDYENSCPRITHVGPVEWSGESLRSGVWVQDLEEDPVDLRIERADGTVIDEVLGHGGVGLTSQADFPGCPHVVVLSKQAVGAGARLTLIPVDIEGCQGEPVTLELAP